VHLIYGALMLLCVVWFVLNILVELAYVSPGWDANRLMVLLIAFAFVFAPLIMHGQVIESAGAAKTRPFVRTCVGVVYVVALAASLYLLLVVTGMIRQVGWVVSIVAPLFLVGLITAAGMFSFLLRPKDRTEIARRERRQIPYWHVMLLSAMLALLIVVTGYITGEVSRFAWWLSVVMRSLPVLMLFLASYYERRFEFFDVFVKKSTLFFVLLLLLFGYFSVVPGLFVDRVPQEMLAWVYAVTLLPLAFAVPWLFARIEGWLDRVMGFRE
jgi:hypothetical protein